MTPATHRFASFDGTEIAWTELGDGPPLILLHGLFSSAATNWLRYGTAHAIAAAGRRVVMPDFRAHGLSAKPRDPAAYLPDVLSLDVEALIAHLNFTDFAVAGYSLGGRAVLRLLARGLAPARAVVCGMGLAAVLDPHPGVARYIRALVERDSLARGDEGFAAVRFMAANGADPVACALLLLSEQPTPAADLARIATPVAIVCGEADHDNGSAEDLAAAIPRATVTPIPGDHMSAVTKPELAAAIVAALA